MEVVLVTPVRLMADGIAACLRGRPDVVLRAAVNDLSALRIQLEVAPPALVLVDVTQGVDLYDLRAIAAQWPAIPLIALGLVEQRQQVIRCGRAGFTGYISRDVSSDALCSALKDAVAGRLICPAEIASSLLRALFRAEDPVVPALEDALTRRESEVLTLIGQGLSNKEIARELELSVATVKHHVHHVLEKLKLQRRAQAMRRVRDAPWLTAQAHATPVAMTE